MKRQRVINIKHESKSYESKEFDLDEYTSKLYEDGWIIKTDCYNFFYNLPHIYCQNRTSSNDNHHAY